MTKTISTAMFAYDKKDKMFSAMASDIGFRNFPLAFTMVSQWTKKPLKMIRTGHRRDAEGDIWATSYVPADNTTDVKVVIFND